MRHARKHPGILASRLLRDMQNGIALGGERNEGGSNKAPACAKAYYHQVLDREKLGTLRNKREQITLCTILDHLALGRTQEAADVAAQRIKSVQMATKQGNWDRSCFLELVPLADGDLCDPSEKKLANREHKTSQSLHPEKDSSANDWKSSDHPDQWGGKKGAGKGKEQPFYKWKAWGQPKKKGRKGQGKKGQGKSEQKYDKDGNPCES